MSCGFCTFGLRIACLLIGATLAAVFGFILIVCWPNWSATLIQSKLTLREGSDNYVNWVEAPIPIYLVFYMFNWTNPHEIRSKDVKPHFTEMGPYVFLERHHKQDIDFHENGTVSYYQRRTWFFDAEKSNGSLDDALTMAHVITATLADEMRAKPGFMKKIVNFMLNHEGGKLHVTKPVREWIFDGYQDDLIDFLNRFNTTKIKIPYKRFGWLVDRNDSLHYDGLFTIQSGQEDLSRLGELTHWRGATETGYYPLPCGQVNGTMGDLFPPHLPIDKPLTIFVTDACRYLTLEPNGTVTRNGLEGIEWLGTENTLDSGTISTQNQCFCPSGNEDCPRMGVVECKKCRNNAPIYISYPHFYLADESYRQAISGLQPDAKRHQFSLIVEPETGIPLEVKGRLQINMMMTSDDSFDIYRDVPNFLMPMFWFEQYAVLDKNLIAETKLAVNLEFYGLTSGWTLAGIALSMYLCCMGFLVVRHKRRYLMDEQLTNEESTSDAYNRRRTI